MSNYPILTREQFLAAAAIVQLSPRPLRLRMDLKVE